MARVCLVVPWSGRTANSVGVSPLKRERSLKSAVVGPSFFDDLPGFHQQVGEEMLIEALARSRPLKLSMKPF